MSSDTTVDLLTELIAACRCEVLVSVNTHRNYYESVEQYMSGDAEVDDASVLAEMIRRDTVVEVQAYNKTPVGFYLARHWDLATALRHVLDAVKNEHHAP